MDDYQRGYDQARADLFAQIAKVHPVFIERNKAICILCESTVTTPFERHRVFPHTPACLYRRATAHQNDDVPTMVS